MRNKPEWHSVALTGLVLLLVSTIFGCALNPRYIFTNGAVMVGGNGEPIELINNPNATNPTYSQLIAFIKEDTTDTNTYIEEVYICADFAETLHNNAEAAGIRAAWVGVEIEGNEEGHALNAFETIDKGMVYINCTGFNPGGVITRMTGTPEQGGYISEYKPTSWDNIAYVTIGKECGFIYIDKAKSLSYSFYEEYKQKWQERERLLSDYNEEVMRYNQEVEGKVYYEGSPELIAIRAWKARLDAEIQKINEMAEELDDFWFEPLGIIKDIQVHWGQT